MLAADLAVDAGADHIAIRDLEMLKGIPGVTNTDVHLVPVIRNTPRERELVDQLETVFADPRFAAARAVLVRDHGAYIWGDDVMDAKRHTEVYHFLFEATVARRDRHPEATPMNEHAHDEHESRPHICPTCQQVIPHTKIDVVDVARAVEADRLTEADVFKRTYLGHGTQSSVFVFQGHPGPFRRHVHTTHDEIGYVLAGHRLGDRRWRDPAGQGRRRLDHPGQHAPRRPVRGRAAGPVHLVADRRSGQPGPRLARRLTRTCGCPRRPATPGYPPEVGSGVVGRTPTFSQRDPVRRPSAKVCSNGSVRSSSTVPSRSRTSRVTSPVASKPRLSPVWTPNGMMSTTLTSSNR